MNPNNLDNNQQQPRPQFEYVDSTPNQMEIRSKRDKIKENLSTIIILISAPILAILLSVFVFRTYQVDGPSMLTTLHDKDRLIINKMPITFANLTGKDYIPARYDVIVLEHSGQFTSSGIEKKQIIKRVIGLPGDRIVVKDGNVTIFNEENPKGFKPDDLGPHANAISTTKGNIDETIKEGEVFVMGDNREESLDSRAIGTIRSEDIIGELVFRIYPFDDWQAF